MGVANTVIYDQARVAGALRPAPGPDARLQGAQGRHLRQPARRARCGREDRGGLLQEFGTLDALYERLDEVKGKLRERLETHRERRVHEPRGRADRDRPADQPGRSRQLARAATTGGRWLSDSASSSSGHSSTASRRRSAVRPRPAPRRTTGAGSSSRSTCWGRPRPAPPRAAGSDARRHGGLPDARPIRRAPSSTSSRGSWLDDADRLELEAWLAAHGEEVAVGWAAGSGRRAARPILGIALAGADGTAWYSCDPEAPTTCSRAGSPAPTDRSSVTT